MNKCFFLLDGAAYDYIIVGAGTTGCVIANRLLEDNKTTVLLIEAGGDPNLEAGVSKYFDKLFYTNKLVKYIAAIIIYNNTCLMNMKQHKTFSRLIKMVISVSIKRMDELNHLMSQQHN